MQQGGGYNNQGGGGNNQYANQQYAANNQGGGYNNQAPQGQGYNNSQYGASQRSFNQGGNNQYGGGNQQYGGNQPQYANNQYGGSQMSMNQGGGGGGANNGGKQASASEYGDQYDNQNLAQYGGHKYGAYGSNLNFGQSAVQESQRNMAAYAQSQMSMSDSQASMADPNRKMKLKPLKWEKPLKKGKTKTQIFIWGKARPPNMFPSSSDQLTPYHVDNLSKKKIWDVCAAREGHHCFGVGQNDWCFVWGETKQIGALGLGTNARSTTPFLIRALRKQRVKQACCSAIHSLCITDQMIIYGWGSKSLTLLESDTKEPTPLNYLNGKGLKKLAAANTHSLAWNTNSIEIWSFGMPGPWLGLDDDDQNQYKKKSFGIMKFDQSIAGNDGFSINFADCSSQYTLLALNTGYVGACGVNEHGRMAVGKKVQSSGKVIWNSKLKNIVLMSAGSMHAGFVDAEGQVFTCGVGDSYRLGHGNTETLWEAKYVESLKHVKVCQIECVDSRTFVITPQGNLILWGTEPVTGRQHRGPFIYEYLSSYRMYDICGAKDFCVAIGIRAKDPIPRPKIDNISVDAMNPNAQMDNMNRLIGDVIGGYHQLGTEQKFNVDSVYGTFIKMKKTVPDNNARPMQYGRGGGQGQAYPQGPLPPQNVVYGGGAQAAMGAQMGGGGGGAMASVLNSMGQGPPPNVVYGGNMGGGGQAPPSQQSLYSQPPQGGGYNNAPPPPQGGGGGGGANVQLNNIGYNGGGSQQVLYQNNPNAYGGSQASFQQGGGGGYGGGGYGQQPNNNANYGGGGYGNQQ